MDCFVSLYPFSAMNTQTEETKKYQSTLLFMSASMQQTGLSWHCHPGQSNEPTGSQSNQVLIPGRCQISSSSSHCRDRDPVADSGGIRIGILPGRLDRFLLGQSACGQCVSGQRQRDEQDQHDRD